MKLLITLQLLVNFFFCPKRFLMQFADSAIIQSLWKKEAQNKRKLESINFGGYLGKYFKFILIST